MLSRLSRQMRLSGFRGETPRDRIELPVAQRSNQVSPNCDLVSITSDKSLLGQGFDPPVERGTNFAAEAGAREIDRLTRDQASVEPCRPFRCHLLIEVEIRAHRERDPPPSFRILKPA